MVLPLAIWTTGAPVPGAKKSHGRFFDMIKKGIGDAWHGELLDVDCEDLPAFHPPEHVAGLVVTGSPARIQDRTPWMEHTMEGLRRYHGADVPILGICFGHQLLGAALGGEAGPNPRGREIGTVDLSFHAHCELVGESEHEPHAVMTHLDSVTKLPPGAQVLASTPLEPHAALRFSPTTWGVQYHPEMTAEIVGHYVHHRHEDIRAEGLNPEAILAARRHSGYGYALLRRFARFCRDRGGRR